MEGRKVVYMYVNKILIVFLYFMSKINFLYKNEIVYFKLF